MVEAPLSCTERCIWTGFKFGHTGPHNSRTMMLAEMSRCLDLLPSDTIAIPDYDEPDRDGLATMGTTALVTPQNWLFLGTYKKLRETLLKTETWEFVARLGEKAFDSPQAAGAFTALLALSNQAPPQDHALAGLDVAEQRTPAEKVAALRTDPVASASQKGQLENPDARISLEEPSQIPRLDALASCLAGILNGDSPKFQKQFWEFGVIPSTWSFQQSTVVTTQTYGGREMVIFFDEEHGHLREDAVIRRERLHDSDQRGNSAWGKMGVAVSQMRTLPVTLYTGEKCDSNAAVVCPKNQAHVAAIWMFCSSPDFNDAVRRIDQKVNVTNATIAKVPFDLAHWQKVAAEKYPNGLPKPHSDDPTQWLFDGFPKVARASRSGSFDTISEPDRDGLATTAAPDRDDLATMQVAVARLLGYRWPRQTGSSFPDCPALGPDGLKPFADADGIVCLNAIKGEQSGTERLRALLAAAVARPSRSGSSSDTIAIPDRDGPDRDGLATPAEPGRDGLATIPDLLRAVGYAGKTLDDWLRNGFFEQHCQLFHQRPFIWQVWDGLRDGFSALINYHKLDRRVLEKLIYTYLGDWIARQKAAVAAGDEGSDAKLAAAQTLKDNLEKILEGEAPYDIFVRWKPLKKQPIGWEPDLNDGVRLNIRPFVNAGILRRPPKIHWRKDRGKDVPSAPWYKLFQGDRINDHHLTLKEKREARGL